MTLNWLFENVIFPWRFTKHVTAFKTLLEYALSLTCILLFAFNSTIIVVGLAKQWVLLLRLTENISALVVTKKTSSWGRLIFRLSFFTKYVVSSLACENILGLNLFLFYWRLLDWGLFLFPFKNALGFLLFLWDLRFREQIGWIIVLKERRLGGLTWDWLLLNRK